VTEWLSHFSYRSSIFQRAFHLFGLNEKMVIDLSQAFGMLNVEWFNPLTGEISIAAKTVGGTKQEFTAPFPGDAVLYIYRD
jgi:hypothetical protein